MKDFFDVPETSHHTSAGDFKLPVKYRDASQFAVNWRVPLERVRPLFEKRSVEPWPIFGKAMVALYVWEYRDSSLGPYGEVGLGILCRRRGTSPSLLKLVFDGNSQDDQGIWVQNLPVTTEDAYVAGVELWGYPKYVTRIDVDWAEDGVLARLGDELELQIGAMSSLRTKGRGLPCYTGLQGRLLRTPIDVRDTVRWATGRSARLVLHGDGPTAQSVRALGLQDIRPLAIFRTDSFEALLPAGKDVGPLAR